MSTEVLSNSHAFHRSVPDAPSGVCCGWVTWRALKNGVLSYNTDSVFRSVDWVSD